MSKIFQIGFNKCATNSIYNLFKLYTVPKFKCVHWDEGFLAKSMYDNMLCNKKLLSNSAYEYYDVYTDMEGLFLDNNKEYWIFMYEYFDILDEQYPGSKFILNTRNKNDWIKSRLKHTVPSILYNNISYRIKSPVKYVTHHQNFYGLSNIDQVIEYWSNQWDNHHIRVMEYFSNRPKDLLIYNIDSGSINDFRYFFSNVEFNTNHMPLCNKTQDYA